MVVDTYGRESPIEGCGLGKKKCGMQHKRCMHMLHFNIGAPLRKKRSIHEEAKKSRLRSMFSLIALMADLSARLPASSGVDEPRKPVLNSP